MQFVNNGSNCVGRHRKCAFLLFLIFVVSTLLNFAPHSYAASVSDSYYAEAMKKHVTPAWSKSEYNAEIDRISNLVRGSALDRSKTRWVNPHVYYHYGKQVVYGFPHGDFYKTPNGKTFDNSGNQGEYKYLGYSFDGIEITNDYWRNSSSTNKMVFKTYDEVNYDFIDDNEYSWNSLSSEQVQFLENTRFIDDDYYIPGMTPFTLKDIFKNNTSEMRKKSYVQTSPGLWRGASVQVRYNGKNHNTLTYDPIGCAFTGSLTTDKNTYTLASGQDQVTIGVSINANFPNNKLVHLSNVEFAYNGINGREVQSISIGGSTSYTKTFNATFNRSSLQTGYNSITLTGYVRAYSIYGERKDIQVSKTITINVESSPTPWVTAVLTAKPTTIKYENKAMSVKLSVSYGINNIRDLNKISDIVITIPGEGSYTLNPVLVGTREIDVTIPASYMTGYNNRDKVYSATIVYNMKDGSSYRSFSSAVVRIYTTQLITPPPTPTPTPTITPTPTPTASPTSTPSPTPTPKPVVINNAPDVKLDVPSWVRAGDTFYARAYASDPDGDNLEYDWRIGNAQGTINGYWGSLWYDKAYVNTNQEIYVFVSDSYTFGYDYAVINVTEPTVKALMKMDGTFKVNRKLTVTDISDTPDYYPVSSRTWTVTPVTYTGTTASDIKHSGDWNSVSEEILFKKAGKYQIQLSVTNAAGYSDTITTTIDVLPDDAPVADFSVMTSMLRDPDHSNLVNVELTNLSYSPDNDYISNIKVYYREDSDNDGDFNEHAWTLMYNGANKDIISFNISNVGKKQFRMVVTEGFGQSTISSFIVESEYLTHECVKNSEVINLAPSVSFGLTEKKKVYLDVQFDDTAGLTKNEIESKLNTILMPQAIQNDIEIVYNVQMKTETLDVGALRTTSLTPVKLNTSKSIAKAWISQKYIILMDYDNYIHVFDLYSESFLYSSAFTDVTTNYLNVLNVCFDMSGSVIYVHNRNTREFIAFNLDNQTLLWKTKINEADYYDIHGGITRGEGYRAYDCIFNGFYADSEMLYAVTKDSVSSKVGVIRLNLIDGSVITKRIIPNLIPAHKNSAYKPYIIDFENNRYYIAECTVVGSGENAQTVLTIKGYNLLNDSLLFIKTENIVYRDHAYLFTLLDNELYWLSFPKAVSGYDPYNYNSSYVNSFKFDINGNKIDQFWVGNIDSEDRPVAVDFNSGCVTIIDINYTGSSWYYTGVEIYELKTNIRRFYSPSHDGMIEGVRASTFREGYGIVTYYWDYYDGTYHAYETFTPTSRVVSNASNILGSNTFAFNSDIGVVVYDKYVFKAFELIKTPSYVPDLSAVDSSYKKYSIFISSKSDLNSILHANNLLKVLDEKASFVGIGTSVAKPKIDDFVVKNEGRGAYIDISNVNTAFNSLATLIVNENSTKYELYNYVEVGQEFDVSTYYYDYENDPAYQHNFVYTHNPNYFENSNGLASNMNVVLTNPNTRFDKVGEYVIEYKAKDNPRSSVYFDNYRLWSEPKTMKIYAHRKPYANFTVTAVANGSSYNVVYEDNSYDLDHLSLPDKGIVTKNWYYRESSSSTWISGKLPATIPADKEYYVKLEVMDMEYSWDSSVQLVSTKPINLKPVAQFRFAKNPASKYQYTAISNVIIDTSFDPNGDSITEKKWTVTKNGVVQSNGINTNLTSAGEGQYAVTLEVKDSKGLWSEPFTQILTVTGDVTPPTISISPTSRGWSDLGMTVNISASDTGGSALKEIRYLWTKNETNPDGQFTVVQNTGYLSLQQNTDGIWYLYAQAVDNAGNASEVVKGGAYKVDKSPPSLLNFRVSGEDYKQDTTFWIAKNNMLEVYINANEQLSGMYLTYLRIPYYSDNRAYHVWIDSWNNVVEFDTGTETRIENAERTIYDPEKGEYEVRFGVRGLNDVVSDLQYCLMDMVDNQTGYINSGYMIGVDTIPPVISITHEELDLSNRSREVSISVEDSGCGVRETKYIVTTDNTKPSNGAGWITEYNRVFNVQVTGTGTWYLYIDSTDNVGNTASQVIGPFRVDMDGPILTANPINRAWGNTNAVITLTATEGYSELKEVRYSLTKSTQRVYTNWKTVTTSSINTVTIPEDGVWYLHAEAEDIAGNITYTYFGPYRVDKEPPVLNINYISGARYISGNNYYAKRGDIVTFQLQGYDALSGIWRLFAMSRGGAGTDPYRSLSKDGSTLQYNDHTKIRVNPPINQYVNYYELRADFPFEVLTAEDYTYIIEGIADDNANFNRYGWVDSGYRLITDNTAPVGQVTFTTNTSSLIADITASDNASGVKEIRYSWSTDPETTISHYTTVTGDTAQAIQTEEGVWYLFLQIEDNCNNVYYYRTDAQELKLLSLYDFNVSDVSDSNWTDVFYAKSGALKGVEYYVDSLPILENPNFYDRFGAVPRKGFEFRFNVKSIGMEEATDRIRITPKFYYWDGYSTRVECNMVYPVLISTFPERYNLIQAGTPAELNHDASKIYDFHDAGLGKPKTKVYLGTYGEIVLDERQRTILADEQLWTGVYKVPDGAVLVPIGQNIMDKDNWITEGYLIVNLQIEAIKNNSIEFTYVPDQWVIESGPRNALYMSGDTIVYNLEQSAFSDYDVRVDR